MIARQMIPLSNTHPLQQLVFSESFGLKLNVLMHEHLKLLRKVLLFGPNLKTLMFKNLKFIKIIGVLFVIEC